MNFNSYLIESVSPEVFGSKHLVGSLIISLLITILLVLLLKAFKTVKREQVLKITAVFLLCLEVTKYTYTVIQDGSFPVYYIPMQLCSFSLYLMPLVAFGKGKLRAFFEPTCFSVGLLAGLIVLLYPATVLGGDYDWLPLSENIIQIISFVYHGTMIFFSLYLLMSKTYHPEIKDYARCYVTLVVFAGMAMITNAIFDTDMMFLNTGSGSPFQFVLLDYGRATYMIFMAVIAAVLLFLPFIPSFVSNYVTALKKKKTTESI